MRGSSTRLSTLAVFTLLSLAPRPAEACSASICVDATLLPVGSAPANVGELLYRPDVRWTNPAAELRAPVLVGSDGSRIDLFFGARVPAPGVLVLVPGAPLVPGTTYLLEHASACPGSEGQPLPPLGPLAIRDSVPVPRRLGRLTATTPAVGPLRIAANASCSQLVLASHVDVDVELDASAEPWRDALVFETRVNGQPWQPTISLPDVVPHGASWRGRGTDRLYTLCETAPGIVEPGLAPGQHTVTLAAALPSGAVVLESEPLEIELGCESPPTDAGVLDAGVLDAAPAVDGGHEAPGLSTDEASCGCRQAGGPHRGVLLAVLCGVLPFLRLGRRSHRAR